MEYKRIIREGKIKLMNKSISQIIDELIIVNIKICHLTEQKNHTSLEVKKLKQLHKHHLALSKNLDNLKPMKKSFSQIIDELTIVNLKIFHLVDKISNNQHTTEDAKKAQDLNKYRSELCNAISSEFKEQENIKV